MTQSVALLRLTGAACVGSANLFSAAIDGDPAATTAAKDVCSACPVRALCLAWAMETREPWGVWGGLDPAERRALRKRQPRPRPSVRAHSRGAYVEGRCRCDICRELNTAYQRAWRRSRPVMRRTKLVAVRELDAPVGRGHGRAYPGQLFIEEAS